MTTDISNKIDMSYKIKYRWEMNLSEPSTLQKRIMREELFNRDVGKVISNAVKCAYEPCMEPIVSIDHITIHHYVRYGEVGCNWLVNTALAHFDCNNRMKQPAANARDSRAQEGVPFSLSTSIPIQTADQYTPTTMQIMINQRAYGPWLKWLETKTVDGQYYPLDWVINEGARLYNVHSKTVQGWLPPLVAGPGAPFATGERTFIDAEKNKVSGKCIWRTK